MLSSVVGATDFKVAVRAKSGIEHAIAQWQPTVDYLNKKMPEHHFVLMPIVSLKEITIQAGLGSYDFVLTNPSSFTEIQSRHGVSPLATLVNDRSGHALTLFGSIIFTRAERVDILTIKDLRGKTIMGVSEPAFGGWRVGWLEMIENGIDPYKVSNVIFSESKVQSEVVYAVRDKLADAGIVRTDQLERMEQSGKIDMRYFKVINNKDVKDFPFLLSTELYPEWPFSVMKHVPRDIAFQVKEVLFSIEKENNAAKAGKYIRWIEPLDYQKVRDLMQKLPAQKR
ncbi:MAG: phosphate/phosphite/phosphonate ABC transporter substrate-binding protein [Gammaproteobacteria bacterium]|nr:phosphate/phosphite/phosphonate ABC transporter substrate-binding protein [Gammaproteobacteria bacterium]